MAGAQGPRERAEAWRPWADAQSGRLVWPVVRIRAGQLMADHVRAWLWADVGPGRLVPWLAVAFGSGVVAYFAAEREPSWWAALALLAGTLAAAIALHRRPIGFAVAVALTMAAGGFATATMKRAWIAHPVLERSAWNVPVNGWVTVREERERSDRITIDVAKISGLRQAVPPERVRVAVRKGTAPPVGTFVALKAKLSPPLQPLRPGGYDFARDLYFKGIGAAGFVLGRVTAAHPPHPLAWRLRVAAWIEGVRDAIDARIRTIGAGDNGAIASALITGKRGAISEATSQAMYISGIGHVLAISGYHMAIVAGVVFFALRAVLALVPAFASRRAIKKWAAVAALATAAFYLVLSGAAVATQRSFIMVAIVLTGVMLERPALTLRTLTVAALVVLLIAPESLVHPSFQMSFAATLALVAVYERGLPWAGAAADTPLGARIALWGGRQLATLIIASVVAGFATTLYAAYHFHRIAPYGLLANLLAMPIVSIWVMPAGLLGLLLMPLGFDAPLWRLMGSGVERMTDVAVWVADLPGAIEHIAAFGVGPLALGTIGLLVLCLLRSPLRFAGFGGIALAAVWALSVPQPDVLIAGDGRAMAVRTENGRLAMVRTGSDSFALQEWLAADGDGRTRDDPALGEGFRCDRAGCVGRLAGGRLVALTNSAEAFDEDCRLAAVVAGWRRAPPGCAAVVVDGAVLARSGAIALRGDGNGFVLMATRPAGYDRPWAPAPEQAGDTPTDAAQRQRGDATPRPQDLEADD